MTRVLKVAVPVPVRASFDYLPPLESSGIDLQPGLRVEVPFGRAKKIGLLMEIAEHSNLEPGKLRRATALLDREPLLSPEDLELLTWASRYYHHPIGETVAAALSLLLRPDPPSPPRLDRQLCRTDCPVDQVQFRRSPRQAALLALLEKEPAGVSPSVLDALDWNWKPAASALIAKGMAVWREIVVDAGCAAVNPSSAPLALNDEQAEAISTVASSLGAFQPFLLEGVTGSGKTEVYLQLAQKVLDQGRQVMVLLPEISLTPQLAARFRARFAAPVVMFHSGLADGERRRAWLAMQDGRAAILLGTRSAVFTPLRAPGLIILDEEHDSSFKQQEGFRFSARDLAVVRARLLNIPVLLGSATPSLESVCNAAQGRYRHLRLSQRATGAAEPRVRVLDIRGHRLREGISPFLAADIAETLARGEQALLFVNRRGFAPTLTCHGCGWVAQCRRCDAHTVIHLQARRLICHHCGFEQPLQDHCPACSGHELRPLGLGTERVENSLAELFPEARIARIDRDSTRRKGELERVLKRVQEGEVDLLIGTQMLAKGHHFPRVTLAGIVDVDAGLYSTDFRAPERTAQLIVQVAGRSGREERRGSVVLQTRHPEHPLLQVLVREGYPGFARACAAEREAAGLPPFGYQALWRAESNDAGAAVQFLAKLAQAANDAPQNGLMVLGPAPAPLARRAGRHRFQLLFQSPHRGTLHGSLARLVPKVPEIPGVRKVRWSLDVDPSDLF